VEMLAEGGGVFTGQSPLTCGGIAGTVAVVSDESDSAADRRVASYLGYTMQILRACRRCTW